jgi:hypothetical protein
VGAALARPRALRGVGRLQAGFLPPGAWPYRDYVIRSFNEDKPFDRFAAEQLAGDELAPGDPDVAVATGFLRHTPYEYNQRDVPKQWADMLADVTDVAGDVFLGLSVGCARCHDHKFDPITHADYYRLQAFFAPMLPRDVPLASPGRQSDAAAATANWERRNADLLAEIAEIEAPYVSQTQAAALAKFPPETQALLAMPPEQRSPFEQQIAGLAYRQIHDPDENPPVKIKDGAHKERHKALKEQLARGEDRPEPIQKVQIVTDVGPVAPPTFVPGSPTHTLEPGCPTVLERDGLRLPAIERPHNRPAGGRRWRSGSPTRPTR